jgi:SAM-dependent methyltransferase
VTGKQDGPALNAWGDGQSYEHYMGRWSRKVAREFVAWLDQPAGLTWLDVGCGTGALTATILGECAPRAIVAIDPAEPFIDYARGSLPDGRVRFEVASASALPVGDGSMDVVASGLALNFFADRPAAFAEMQRVAKPAATIAFYVWDYPGGGMGFMDAFWEAAMAVSPGAASAEERSRFPFCTPDGLLTELRTAGLVQAEVRAIEVTARFADFDDLWAPFTQGTGPAPAYYQRLDAETRVALKRTLAASVGDRVPIEFPARAWALRGRPG